MSTVLVLRWSSAGDIVLTAPALEALSQAWPEARIVFVTKPQFVDLVRAHPCVHEVETLRPGEGTLALSRRLAARAPDAVLDLHGKARGFFLRRLAPRRVVWTKRGTLQGLRVRLGLAPYRAEKLIARRYHDAVEKLVGRALPPGRLRYYVHPDDAARARERLVAAGVDLGRPLCGMSPGALWETKRWPAERFGELAARLVTAGVQVVQSGSKAEAAFTAAVRARAPGAVDLAGQLTLGELGGLIDACTAFVANDSGPMHMARGLGVPTLAFFGSTDPRQFDFSGHAVLFAELPCAPCSLYGKRRCPEGHFRCMLDLDVERALRAVLELSRGGRRAAVVG